MPNTEQVEMTENTPDTEMVEGTDAGTQTTSASELEDIRKALKKANAEAAANRKALQAYQDAEEKRKQSEMTEVEKLQAKLTEMVSQQEATQQSLRETKLNAAIDLTAKTLKFRKVQEARALINRDALEFGEDGEWSGVEDALKALAKDSPHLIEAVNNADTDGLRRNQVNTAAIDEQNRIRSAQTYGIDPNAV